MWSAKRKLVFCWTMFPTLRTSPVANKKILHLWPKHFGNTKELYPIWQRYPKLTSLKINTCNSASTATQKSSLTSTQSPCHRVNTLRCGKLDSPQHHQNRPTLFLSWIILNIEKLENWARFAYCFTHKCQTYCIGTDVGIQWTCAKFNFISVAMKLGFMQSNFLLKQKLFSCRLESFAKKNPFLRLTVLVL